LGTSDCIVAKSTALQSETGTRTATTSVPVDRYCFYFYSSLNKQIHVNMQLLKKKYLYTDHLLFSSGGWVFGAALRFCPYSGTSFRRAVLFRPAPAAPDFFASCIASSCSPCSLDQWVLALLSWTASCRRSDSQTTE